MSDVAMIGIDLAKRVFHAHGARADGSVVFRQKLPRSQVLPFLEKQPRCVVAMEACASAHQWGRAIVALGHEVRLIPPIYVKPFVKRQKNDTADAEAIAEACSRPTKRYVAVKTEEQQARAMIFRTRDLLVRQRTQLINALRGHLAEHGIIAPQGPANLKVLAIALEDPNCELPALVRELGALFVEQIVQLGGKISDIERALRREAQRGTETRRLQTMPGVGPITAMAVEAFAPPMSTFKRGREFRRLAWACTDATFHRRQAAAWPHVENGTARYPSPSYHRSHVCGSVGVPPRSSRRVLAAADDGSKAADAGGDGFGKQDGALDLGDVDEAGELQGSCRCSCVRGGSANATVGWAGV
jgi:transposase